MIRVTGDQPSRRLYALLQEVTGDNAVNILYTRHELLCRQAYASIRDITVTQNIGLLHVE